MGICLKLEKKHGYQSGAGVGGGESISCLAAICCDLRPRVQNTDNVRQELLGTTPTARLSLMSCPEKLGEDRRQIDDGVAVWSLMAQNHPLAHTKNPELSGLMGIGAMVSLFQ